MNVYDEVILTISLISLAIGLFGVYIYFGYKIKKLEDTVDNLYSYFTVALEPQIKRIREVVNNEIINKKEDTSINNPDWMYAIFDKDKIKAYKERQTKEAEERGMTLIEYLESKEKLSWLGKRCEDCGNKKCKELGELPKGYDCALWQPESEE